MDSPSVGSIVLLPFPFSDLSNSKIRPALILAAAGRGDWILCQITSKAYADSTAVELKDSDFELGGLRLVSYARPSKMFREWRNLSFASRAAWHGENIGNLAKGGGLICIPEFQIKGTAVMGKLIETFV